MWRTCQTSTRNKSQAQDNPLHHHAMFYMIGYLSASFKWKWIFSSEVQSAIIHLFGLRQQVVQVVPPLVVEVEVLALRLTLGAHHFSDSRPVPAVLYQSCRRRERLACDDVTECSHNWSCLKKWLRGKWTGSMLYFPLRVSSESMHWSDFHNLG